MRWPCVFFLSFPFRFVTRVSEPSERRNVNHFKHVCKYEKVILKICRNDTSIMQRMFKNDVNLYIESIEYFEWPFPSFERQNIHVYGYSDSELHLWLAKLLMYWGRKRDFTCFRTFICENSRNSEVFSLKIRQNLSFFSTEFCHIWQNWQNLVVEIMPDAVGMYWTIARLTK